MARLAIGYGGLSALWLMLGLVVSRAPLLGALRAGDVSASHWVQARRNAGLTDVANGASASMNTLAAIVTGAAVMALLRRSGWRTALAVPVAMSLELLVFLTVNLAVARPRPAIPHVGSTPTTHSFPSGHAAVAVVIWVGGALLLTRHAARAIRRSAAVTVATVPPLLVGLARLYRGMHHLSDVVAGWLLGGATLWVVFVALGLRNWSPRSRPC